MNLFESIQKHLNESVSLPSEAKDLGNGTKGECYRKTENSCKENAVQAYIKDNSEEIYAGSVKADGVEIAHFFNVKNGEVIDHSFTAQNHEMADYKGVPISSILTDKGFKLQSQNNQYCKFENSNGDIVECGNYGNKLWFTLNGKEVNYSDVVNLK